MSRAADAGLPNGETADSEKPPTGESPKLPPPERRVAIGLVVKLHGLRGDLKVQPSTWRPERFEELAGVWLEGVDGRIHWLTPKRLRIERDHVFIRFREAPLREFAEPLVGGRLFIDERDRDALPRDVYYIDDLVGCRVVCSRNGELGLISEVLDLPANDVWRVDGRYGEVLIPAIRDVVHKIDIERKLIHITLPDGLLPDGETESRVQ